MLFPKKSILVLAAILSFLFLLPVRSDASFVEDDAIRLMNAERQKQNLSTLVHSDKLYQAALSHNKKMIDCTKSYGKNSCFTHTITLLNEQILLTRIKATGYNAVAVAENLAWGYSTAGGIVGAWMSSSGHRGNIMGNYKDVGCSYSSPYWTCDFGRTSSTTTQTPTRIPTVTPIPSPSSAPTVLVATPTSVIPSIPTPTSKPWWCVYAPQMNLCQ